MTGFSVSVNFGTDLRIDFRVATFFNKCTYIYISINADSWYATISYRQRFGAHRVEFDDPDRERKPKESVALLRDIFDDNGFNSLRDVNQRKRYHDVVEFYTRGEKPLGQSQGSLSRQVNVAGLAVIMIFWTLIVSLA